VSPCLSLPSGQFCGFGPPSPAVVHLLVEESSLSNCMRVFADGGYCRHGSPPLDSLWRDVSRPFSERGSHPRWKVSFFASATRGLSPYYLSGGFSPLPLPPKISHPHKPPLDGPPIRLGFSCNFVLFDWTSISVPLFLLLPLLVGMKYFPLERVLSYLPL